MSNFFRDNNIGFKPRHNIFTKLRSGKEVDIDDTSDSSILDNPFFQRTDETTHVISHVLSPEEKLGSSKETLAQSTPIQAKQTNNEKDEELEITEVREVSLNDDKIVNVISEKSPESSNVTAVNANNSSNDVLLEAFTNTQRICTNLKIELQKMQQKNSQQKDLIDQYKMETGKLTEKIHAHKALLSSLEVHVRGLKEKKSENEASIKSLSINYHNLSDRVKSLLSETDFLRGTINANKSVQKNLENVIQQKNKELEYIKRELNECSGQLSEEKIKFNELLQQIINFKREMSSEIKQLLKENMKTEVENMDTIKEYISQNSLIVSKKLDVKTDNIVQKLKEQLEKLTETNDVGITELQKFFTSSVQSVKLDLSTQDEKALKFCSLVNDQLDKMYIKLEDCVGTQNAFFSHTIPGNFDELRTALEKANSQFKDVPNLVKNILNNIKKSDQYKSEISILSKELDAIKLKKSEVVNLLKEKDHEIDELNNKIFDKGKEIDSLKYQSSELRTKVEDLTKQNEEYTSELTKSKKESECHIVSLNSKLSAQLEINSLLEKELNQAKEEIKIQIEAKEKIINERECSKDSYESLQQQFQRVNIELVQAKAKELELGEINRTLKEQLQETESSSVQIHNTVRELKDKISILEEEKTGLNLEKLDLLDKLENLENTFAQWKRKQATLNPPKKVQVPKSLDDDAFALSSDDLEMTNPEYPLQQKAIEPQKIHLKSTRNRRKKLLLSDEIDGSPRLKKNKRLR